MSRNQGDREEFTHEDLRKMAVRWLTTTRKCSVVLSELVTFAGEIPDAIGWHNGSSILVEVKVSRADFRRNADKCFIRAGRGMGNRRYFMTPDRLVTEQDLGDGCDYGLLYVTSEGRIKLIKEAARRETEHSGEICMLVSALRRVRTREYLTINVVAEESGAYSIDSPPFAPDEVAG